MSKPTPVEWLMEQIRQKDNLNNIRLGGTKALNQLFETAKEMEEDREYETKAFWFGRGIHAGRENKIEDLKPVKP